MFIHHPSNLRPPTLFLWFVLEINFYCVLSLMVWLNVSGVIVELLLLNWRLVKLRKTIEIRSSIPGHVSASRPGQKIFKCYFVCALSCLAETKTWNLYIFFCGEFFSFFISWSFPDSLSFLSFLLVPVCHISEPPTPIPLNWKLGPFHSVTIPLCV